MISHDQLDLIEAFLDDALPEDALRRVRELVAVSPEFARELQLAMQLRGQCAVSQGVDAEAFADTVMLRLAAPEPAEAEAPRLALRMRSLPPPPTPAPLRFPQPTSRVEPRRSGWSWGQWAAAAALFVLLAGLAGFFAWNNGNIGTVRGRDGEASLVRGGRGMALVPGATVRVGDQLRTGKGGSALVAYRDGTTLQVVPESQLVLGSVHGAKRIRLDSGAIHMDVSKQPDDRPLEIVTDHSRCIVRGTKLDVVNEGNHTRLEVQEGQVEMRTPDQKESVMVAAGQQAVADGTSVQKLRDPYAPVFQARLSGVSHGFPPRPVPVSVDIRGARKLYLLVTDNCDYPNGAYWIHPRLTGPSGTLDLTTIHWKRGKCGYRLSPVPDINPRQAGEQQLEGGRKLTLPCIHVTAVSLIEYEIPPGHYERFEAEVCLSLIRTLSNPARCDVTFGVYTDMPADKVDAIMRLPLRE